MYHQKIKIYNIRIFFPEVNFFQVFTIDDIFLHTTIYHVFFFDCIVTVANQKIDIYIIIYMYINTYSIYTSNDIDFQKLKFHVRFKPIEIFDKNLTKM